MGRKIDFSKPLTAEEAEYVAARPWLVTDAKLAGFTVEYDESEDDFEDEDDEDLEDSDEESEEDEDSDGEDGEGYSKLTVPELKELIEARNEERDEDDQIEPAGTKKADLIAALEADDAEQ